ncbi:MAG: synthase related protein, partial [Rhizobacter sp.]|nr:synthase related protein [Rhizobacter sp.]
LRGDLEVLAGLAEDGLCTAAKDISMAGSIGTALMMLECSKAGAVIDVDAIPRPDGAPLLRWLQSFPSYGFVMSVRPDQVDFVLGRFESRDIACAVVGEVMADPRVWLRRGDAQALLWNVDDAFITARAPVDACAPDARIASPTPATRTTSTASTPSTERSATLADDAARSLA